MSSKQIKLLSVFVVCGLIVSYGFYEKDRRAALYTNFNSDKELICAEFTVQKSKGWRIQGGRFFTDGKVMKSIVFCKSTN